ncbi:MAG: efflux RND transporter periplasmic adaptor subunit [Hyphomicrobium sp.]
MTSTPRVVMAMMVVIATTAVSAAPDETAIKTILRRDFDVPVRGVVKALGEATISSEIAARVASVNFKEGERFRKDDTLIAFDCRRKQAELAAATAVRKEAQVSIESNAFLSQRDAASKQDVAIAAARAEKAESEVRALTVEIEFCRITAPFSGRVAMLGIREHEVPAIGRPLLTILSDGDYEIELIVPSHWLSVLSLGDEFTFNIDETERSYGAKLVRIAASVDTISQTVKVTARFKDQAVDVLPGMSGSAHFKVHRD